MDSIAIFALFVSIISLSFNIVDRFPRIRVSANLETEYFDIEGAVDPGVTRLWITISNQSTRRIFVTDVYAQWSWYLLLPLQWKKIELEDLQRYENEKLESTKRFWIEPWGNVVLSADAENTEYELRKRFSDRFNNSINRMINNLLNRRLNYRILVYDGQQKGYRSNKIRIIESHKCKRIRADG
jgi:hypothetical protein